MPCSGEIDRHPPPSKESTCPRNYEGAMQAISAIIDPATVGPSRDTKVIIWQSLPNGTLGHDQLEFDDDKVKPQSIGQVKGYYGASVLAPWLRFPSNLVSVVVDSTVQVYGVRQNNDKNVICMFSPVFMPLLNAEIANGVVAGCSNGADKAWLYFQQYNNDQRRHVIMEKSLNKVNTKATVVDETDNSKPDTNIVAFFDGKHRWIAYQTLKNDIKVRCCDRPDEDIVDDSKSFVGDKIARLAAVTVVASGVNRIYIYFSTSDGGVYRSFSDVKDGGMNFKQPYRLDQKLQLNAFAQMSIVADVEKRENVIYTISEGGEGIERFHDAWAS